VIVVKAGGRALLANRDRILDSLVPRIHEGVVFVHGGGDVVSDYEKRLGIEPQIVTSPHRGYGAGLPTSVSWRST
jgi:acetylglutamate/LysW-gamma-L-alpha-aminoadipate kinase